MSRTSCLVERLSGRCTGATATNALFAPAGCGVATAETSGSRLICAATVLTCAEPAGGVAVQRGGVPVVQAGERLRVVPGPLDESGVVFGVGRWHRPGSGGGVV